MQHLKEADGSGKLDINGKLSDIPYHLVARKDDNQAYSVEISLSAPRDWLLQRGFDKQATLVIESGKRVAVHAENHVGVEGPISVVLTSGTDICRSPEDVSDKYPELKL